MIENFCMESPYDDCVGSFVEAPVASTDFNIPSTSKGKGRRNDSKGKNPQKEKERMLSQRTLEASLEAQLL